MAGYPNAPPNYGGYGPPPSYPYTSTSTSHGVPPPNSQPPYATPYGAPSAPYAPHPADKPPKEKPGKYSSSGPPSGYPSMPPPPSAYGNSPPPPSAYGSSHPPPPSGYGSSHPPPSGYGSSPPPPSAYGGGPPSAYGGGPPSGYGTSHYGSSPPPAFGSPFASLVPSQFPPGTDPNVVACFQLADRDGSGFIDDKELQSALSSYNQSFSIRTVRLLMYSFTNTNTRKIGPKEFTAVFYSLQNWRAIFERFDRDRSGRIDMNELREALLSLGFSVSPVVLELLVSKFDKSGGRNQAIEYDNFIECCLTVKGLTEKFKEKDTSYSGSATFSYDAFMLSVLPFLIA